MRGDKKREKRILKYLDLWSDFLGVNQTYHLEAVIIDTCSCNSEGMLTEGIPLAVTEVQFPYRDATISFTREGVDECEEEELERVVIHELLHVIMSPMGTRGGWKAISRMQDLPDKDLLSVLSIFEEEVTDVLTRVLLRLKDGKMKG